MKSPPSVPPALRPPRIDGTAYEDPPAGTAAKTKPAARRTKARIVRFPSPAAHASSAPRPRARR